MRQTLYHWSYSTTKLHSQSHPLLIAILMNLKWFTSAFWSFVHHLQKSIYSTLCSQHICFCYCCCWWVRRLLWIFWILVPYQGHDLHIISTILWIAFPICWWWCPWIQIFYLLLPVTFLFYQRNHHQLVFWSPLFSPKSSMVSTFILAAHILVF